jgi:hypothetical protein
MALPGDMRAGVSSPYSTETRGFPMTFETLMRKLFEIERAAVTGDVGAILSLTFEAEDMMLQLERELIDTLRRIPQKAA